MHILETAGKSEQLSENDCLQTESKSCLQLWILIQKLQTNSD